MKILAIVLGVVLSGSVAAETITITNSDGSSSTVNIPPDTSTDWGNKF